MDFFLDKNNGLNTQATTENSAHNKQVLLKLKESDSYGAVAIGRCGCQTASYLIGTCFSFDEVPTLPLKGCSAAKCTCEYEGVHDRRAGERRKEFRRIALRMEDDRRKKGRRKQDQGWNINDI